MLVVLKGNTFHILGVHTEERTITYLCFEHKQLDEDGPVMWRKAILFCPSHKFSFRRRDVGVVAAQQLTASYPFACLSRNHIVWYSLGITPARNDLLTDATDGRSLPERKANISSNTSRFKLSAETMSVWGMKIRLFRPKSTLQAIMEDRWLNVVATRP